MSIVPAEYKPRTRGEQYRPMAKVLKERNGIPTKVAFNGNEYALINKDYINGNKDKHTAGSSTVVNEKR